MTYILYLCCGDQIDIPVPTNFWNISDWQRTRQEWQTKVFLERPNFIMANRKSKKVYDEQSPRPDGDRWNWIWSLEQVWIAGTRLVFVGLGLLSAGAEKVGICGCRKVIAGAGLAVADAELVAAGICWCRKVIAGAGKQSLLQDWQLLVQNW